MAQGSLGASSPGGSPGRGVAVWAHGVITSRRFVPICLLLALVVRVIWVLVLNPAPVSDFGWFYARAIDIAAGRGYSVDGVPTALWPVGYPAFLGGLFKLFGTSLLAAKLANVVFYMGILGLSYHLARRFFRSELVARLSLLILSFYPDHIAYTSLLANEMLAVFLLLLSVALYLAREGRMWHAVLAGLAFGAACLVKPHFVLVPPIVFGATVLARKGGVGLRARALRLAIVYVVLAATLVPWTVRNYRAFGNFVFVSNNGGIVLLIGNNRHAPGRYDWRKELTEIVESPSEYERDQKARRAALDYMRAYPGRVVRLWPRKFLYLYYYGREAFRRNVEGLTEMDLHYLTPDRARRVVESLGYRKARLSRLLGRLSTISQIYYAGFVIAALGGVICAFVKRREKRFAHPFLGLVITCYFTAVHLITFAAPRYHFPMIPWIVMYAAVFLALLLSWASGRAFETDPLRPSAAGAERPVPSGGSL
jgi:4-amino-4-deoxy-L-arabinose transferase-like glycosyltransferase